MIARRIGVGLLETLVALLGAGWCDAAATLSVSINGHAVQTVTPGARIGVSVRGLPAARWPYCLGLISAIDRTGLPLSLGPVTRDASGQGHVLATIPPRLFPAEPAGPYILFVGRCTSVAPDRPFVAHTTIRIVPAATLPH